MPLSSHRGKHPVRKFLTGCGALGAACSIGTPIVAIAQPPASTTDSSSVRATINLDAERQVIENFGASDAWTFQTLGAWSPASRKQLADLLFSKTRGIGLSCWRFNVGAGFNPQIASPSRTTQTFEVAPQKYDWNQQKTEQWFLSAAKARGVEQFVAFVNSPPSRLTRNGLTFSPSDKSTTNLKPGAEDAFALYLADILDHFRTHPNPKQRIDFDYVSPINEPQWDWQSTKQEGNRASNDDFKAVVRALHARLRERSIPTKILAVESGTLPDMWGLNQSATKRWGAPYGNYLNAFTDAEMAPLLDHRICYHAYFSDLLSGKVVDHRRRLAAEMAKHPDWTLWQSEYCILEGPEGKGGGGRDLSMKTALDVARVIHLDLTLANVSAWQWWLALSSVDFKDGLIYTDYKKVGDKESIIPSKLLWTLGNYSRFVRPGMRRIEIEGVPDDIRGLMCSAYKNERDQQVVLVCANQSQDAKSFQPAFDSGTRDWKLRSISRYITSDAPGDDLKRSAVSLPARDLTIPPRSVVTFVAQFK